MPVKANKTNDLQQLHASACNNIPPEVPMLKPLAAEQPLPASGNSGKNTETDALRTACSEYSVQHLAEMHDDTRSFGDDLEERLPFIDRSLSIASSLANAACAAALQHSNTDVQFAFAEGVRSNNNLQHCETLTASEAQLAAQCAAADSEGNVVDPKKNLAERCTWHAVCSPTRCMSEKCLIDGGLDNATLERIASLPNLNGAVAAPPSKKRLPAADCNNNAPLASKLAEPPAARVAQQNGKRNSMFAADRVVVKQHRDGWLTRLIRWTRVRRGKRCAQPPALPENLKLVGGTEF